MRERSKKYFIVIIIFIFGQFLFAYNVQADVIAPPFVGNSPFTLSITLVSIVLFFGVMIWGFRKTKKKNKK